MSAGVRLPRALTTAFIDQALKASEGVAGLSAAMRGLSAARAAVMSAVAAIDADMRRMTRASAACRRLMTIPGVGQLTALAFVAAIDDPSRIRRSQDIGAYLGLVPRRYQSGEVDYTGGISKCGDKRVRTANESKTESTAQAVANELAKAPSCRRIVFETGRMAPILFHGLSQLGLPVVCVESRQAYQALKSLATHKTDRNDARGLAHLARTGFFKPVHVKSLSAHAVRSLIIARKKLVGQRVTLENQIRGLAVVFGVRLPRALTAAFIDNALKASEGIAGLSAAMRGLIAARTAVMTAVAAIDADMRRMTRASAACRRLMTIPGVGQLTALAFVAAIDEPSRIRRSRDVGAYLGLVPRRYQSGEVDYIGSISKCGDRRVRTLLYEAANVMLTRYKGQLKLKDWAFAIAKRSTMRKARVALARRLAIIMHAMLRDGTEFAFA